MNYWVQVQAQNGETWWSNYSAGVQEVECLEYHDTSPAPPTKPRPLPNYSVPNYSAGVQEVECLEYRDTPPVPPTKPWPLPNPGHVIHIHTASEEPKHLTRETRSDSNQCVVWFLIIAFVSFVVIVIERVVDS